MSDRELVAVEHIDTADGARLAVWSHGDGYPLVAMPPEPFVTIQRAALFLEEYGIDQHPWYLPGYRTLRYDPRGVGESSGAFDYSLPAQVSDLGAVVASADRPVVLAANWHAGPAAIAYAHAHPERVALLVLVCAYANARRDFIRTGRVSTIAKILPADPDLFISTALNEAVGWSLPLSKRIVQVLRSDLPGPRRMMRTWRQLDQIDVTDLVGRVTVPTLVFQRRDCGAPTLATAGSLAASIPRAELVVFPGSAAIAIVDQPELMQRVLAPAADYYVHDGPNPGPLQRLLDRDLAARTLTSREQEVVALVATGRTNEGIAVRLAISPATVKNHLSASFAKLGAASRTDAVHRARTLGIID